MNTGLSSSANTMACSGESENFPLAASKVMYSAAAWAASHSRINRSFSFVARARSTEVDGPCSASAL